MGDLLNIRVQAFTYDERKLGSTWPRLCSLIWPYWFDRLALKVRGMKDFGPVSAPGSVEKALGTRSHGVVELAEGLADMLRFGDMDEKVRAALQGDVAEVTRLNAELAKALANWDTKAAGPLTNTLEDALAKVENKLENLSN